ncbi:MAG: hypothetical protein WED34_02470 [Planctomycetales bacterium]
MRPPPDPSAAWRRIYSGLKFMLWYSSRWPFGGHLKENSKGTAGYEPVLIVFALLIAQVVALTISEVGTIVNPSDHVRWESVVIYVAAVIVELGALVAMLTAPKAKERNPVHAFDPGTVRLLRYILGGALFFSILIIGMAVTKNLPGQSVRRGTPLHFVEAIQHRFATPPPAEGRQGMKVTFELRPEDFSEGTPPVLRLDAWLDDQLHARWQVKSCELRTAPEDGKGESIHVSRIGSDRDDQFTEPREVAFEAFEVPKAVRCRADFLVLPRTKEAEAQRDEALARISERKSAAFSVTAEPR